MPGTSATVGRGEQAADAQPDLDLTPHGGADRKNGVSRRHARLLYDEGRFHVIDAGSRNGTFVDGRRVPADQPIPLHDGAVLAFGGLETVVSIEV